MQPALIRDILHCTHVPFGEEASKKAGEMIGAWESVYIQMVLVDVTMVHIPFMTPDEALNSVSHAPVINFLAPNLVVGGILFRVCCETLLHELWRPECSFVGTAAQELGGHNSDYVSHNSLSASELNWEKQHRTQLT